MTHLIATVRGEPDTPPFTKIFDFDDELFFSSAALVQKKIHRKMKINVNEALLTYCAYVAKAVRRGKKDSDIRNGAGKILSGDNVMIGVPETLQEISITVDSKVSRKISIKKPITMSNYMMIE